METEITELQRQARDIGIALGQYRLDEMSVHQLLTVMSLLGEMTADVQDEISYRVICRYDAFGDGSEEQTNRVLASLHQSGSGRLRDMAVLFPESREVER